MKLIATTKTTTPLTELQSRLLYNALSEQFMFVWVIPTKERVVIEIHTNNALYQDLHAFLTILESDSNFGTLDHYQFIV